MKERKRGFYILSCSPRLGFLFGNGRSTKVALDIFALEISYFSRHSRSATLVINTMVVIIFLSINSCPVLSSPLLYCFFVACSVVV